MHQSNEFDDDPPTVISSFRYEKLPPPRIQIALDPYEKFYLAATIWASRHTNQLLIAGEVLALIIATLIASQLMPA